MQLRHLGYNFEVLDEQMVAQQQFPQLLAELRTLKQQNRLLQQQAESDNAAAQKLQLGMDTRDQAMNSEIQQLRRQLERQQAIIDEQNKRQQQIDRASQLKDPMWEQSTQNNDCWQQDLQRPVRPQYHV